MEPTTITQSTQSKISFVGDELTIFVPKALFGRFKKFSVVEEHENAPSNTDVDFSDLKGVLKGIQELPEFKGKSSVEIQHMITQLWTRKHLS